MDVNIYHLAFLLGLIIIILTLLRMLGQRARQNAEKQRQRETALQAVRDAERKKTAQTNLPKTKVSPPKTRIPLGDSLGTPFTGTIQGHAARWEAEIHQLGRQIIGQIDSKMAALQAITLEANRTANRLEILVEHLEQIARKQIERQQKRTITSNDESLEAAPTVVPAEESVPAAAPLAYVLKELMEDVEEIRQSVKQSTTLSELALSEFTEQIEQATILRMEEVEAKKLRSEVEMLANYGLEPQEIAQRLNISFGEVDLILERGR